MATKTLENLRDRLEQELGLPSADTTYADTTIQLDDLNEAYRATADEYTWPTLLERTALIPAAAVGRYTLPTNFRKAYYLNTQGVLLDEEVQLEDLPYSAHGYSIDKVNSDIILRTIPQTAPTSYTLANSETASGSVTVELDDTTGLAAGDEVFVDSATASQDEYGFVSTVVDSTSITIRLKRNKTAGDVMYLVRELIDLYYYKTPTALSTSTDTTLLPDTTDFIIPHYAAALYFARNQQWENYDRQMKMWSDRLLVAYRGSNKNSAGESIQFTL